MAIAEKMDVRRLILGGIQQDISIVGIDILYMKMTESTSGRDLLLREDVINENRAVIDALINNNKQIILNDLIGRIKHNKSLKCIHTLEEHIDNIDSLRGVDQYNTRRCHTRIVQEYAAYIEMYLSKNR